MLNESAPVIKICRDCQHPFKDYFDTYTKCSHCRERDQNYTERAAQEREERHERSEDLQNREGD